MGLKSRPLLKSTQLFRTLLVFGILSLFSLHFSLSTFPSLSYALDEGGAITSLEYRSVDRESPLSKSNQYEMNYHLDAWQNMPNVGKLFLWLDWINGENDDKINKLGRGYLALRDFRYNGFIFNGFVGDSTLIFTNLPEKFSNAIYPDIYFRGFQADLLSKWGMVEVFGGKVARLEGLLGKTYDVTDEVFYGFKGSFRPIPRLLLGTGFIRTQDEVDSADKPATKNNNIFLFDSEMEVLKWMRWQTEFRLSDFKGEPGTESQSDYLLRFGPMIKSENFKLEANYRRIGTDYRFVNQATQVEMNQEGFFLLTEYRPWKELTLFGNADRYNDNVSNEPDRNTTQNTRGLIGLSFFSPKYPSFYLTFDMTDRKTRFDFPSPVDNLTTTLYSEVRYQYKDFNPYVRYRWVDYKDKVTPVNENIENDITLGIRKNFKQGSIVYIEGESDQKKYSDGGKETDLSGKIGFNYYFSTNLSCWGEAIYSKLKDREEDSKRDRIEGALGLSAQLPWDIQVYGDIRYDKILNPQKEDLKSQGIQANLRVTKKFNWGKREKIAGLKPGIETKGYGTVEGVVFNDINRNGVQDKGEEGVKGITIRLEDGSTAKTDEKGYYQFSRVEVGGHLVTLDVRRIPADYSTISPEKMKVEVKLRETGRVNFQLIAAGRIEGRVIDDKNANGKSDPGEKGIPDVLVFLQPGDNNSYTDEDGKFLFENIIPGEYRLKLDPVTLPEDSVFTSPEQLKFEVPVGGELKDMTFLIHVKPRPIIIGPPKK
jgi:predicted porin